MWGARGAAARGAKRSAALALGVGVAAACGDGEAPTAAGPTVRDSAGIEIVENAAPRWGDDEGWTVSAEPILAVGSLDGDDPYLLAQVAAPTLRSDGSLVLANGGTRQVRAFAPDGSLQWEAGGEGEGPGEFLSLSWVGVLPGDSVSAWDIRTRRVTVFAPDGTLARTYASTPAEGAPMAAPRAVLEGGRLLVSGGVSFSGGDGAATEVVWPESAWYLADLTGAIVDSVTAVPSLERVVWRDQGSVGIFAPPLARTGFLGARGAWIVSGASQSIDLQVRTADGAVVRRVRLATDARTPTAGDVERAVDAQLGPDADPEVRRSQLQRLVDVPLPDRYPVADDVLVEDDGTIWLRIWRAPWERNAPARWRVFDSSGAYLGIVTMPQGFELEAIQGGRLVGIHTDALEVEQVRVYGVVR